MALLINGSQSGTYESTSPPKNKSARKDAETQRLRKEKQKSVVPPSRLQFCFAKAQHDFSRN
jgi:hypothetical protein